MATGVPRTRWQTALAPHPENGGDAGNTDVEFEGRGTIQSEDAPFSVIFTNAREDTFILSLVRTGRVTVRADAP